MLPANASTRPQRLAEPESVGPEVTTSGLLGHYESNSELTRVIKHAVDFVIVGAALASALMNVDLSRILPGKSPEDEDW